MDKKQIFKKNNNGDIMFNHYEIKNEKNEKILYLYLDINTEFAKLGKQDKTNIKKEIKNYINNNKIPFKKGKIVLMAGSLVLGTLLFTSSPKQEINMIDHNYTQNILVLTEKELNPPRDKKIEESKIEEPKKEEIKVKETTPNKNKIEKEKTINNKNSTTIKEPNIIKEKNIKQEETKKAEETSITEAKIMVSIKRSSGVILYLELEEYIIGVVAAEMPASFHSEALKAQAIASRTFALKQIEDNVILTDTTSTQVYKDNNELKKLWGSSYNTYYNKVKQAVKDTEGLIMTYNGSIINAYYHSTSNGYTENASAVFKNYPYLVSVESLVDKKVSSYERTKTYSYEEISKLLNIPITPLSTIKIVKNSTNHVETIILDNNTYSGVKFRSILSLRSTDFEIILSEDNVVITTHGYGHGVGMSQYGANEYAKLGWDYKKILTHYYTGVKIEKY